jgi:ribosome-binding protein aMBF1 (putative translation factor)
MASVDESLDDLDAFIAESSTNPIFKAAYEQARQRRLVIEDLHSRRKAAGLSRTVIAGRMGTSEAAVARLESGHTDPRISSLERWAAAVGFQLDVRLVPIGPIGNTKGIHAVEGGGRT